MWEKIGFCIVCFIGMVVGEVLANRINKYFETRSVSKNEIEIEMEIRNQNVNEDINSLKNKIDGR